jgi:hypothetical protein|nr:MAG TPA: hypothetical protein [Caudoviricetes sp.]
MLVVNGVENEVYVSFTLLSKLIYITKNLG